MHSFFLFTIFFPVIGVYGAKPPATTEAVRQFTETQELWELLKQHWMLPGSHNPFLNAPPTNKWITYLEEHGAAAVESSYQRTRTVHKDTDSDEEHSRLVHFVKDPMTASLFKMNHGVTRGTSFFLIKDYAARLKEDPNNDKIYAAMKKNNQRGFVLPTEFLPARAVQGSQMEDASFRTVGSSGSSSSETSVKSTMRNPYLTRSKVQLVEPGSSAFLKS